MKKYINRPKLSSIPPSIIKSVHNEKKQSVKQEEQTGNYKVIGGQHCGMTGYIISHNIDRVQLSCQSRDSVATIVVWVDKTQIMKI